MLVNGHSKKVTFIHQYTAWLKSETMSCIEVSPRWDSVAEFCPESRVSGYHKQTSWRCLERDCQCIYSYAVFERVSSSWDKLFSCSILLRIFVHFFRRLMQLREMEESGQLPMPDKVPPPHRVSAAAAAANIDRPELLMFNHLCVRGDAHQHRTTEVWIDSSMESWQQAVRAMHVGTAHCSSFAWRWKSVCIYKRCSAHVSGPAIWCIAVRRINILWV